MPSLGEKRRGAVLETLVSAFRQSPNYSSSLASCVLKFGLTCDDDHTEYALVDSVYANWSQPVISRNMLHGREGQTLIWIDYGHNVSDTNETRVFDGSVQVRVHGCRFVKTAICSTAFQSQHSSFAQTPTDHADALTHVCVKASLHESSVFKCNVRE